MDVYDRLSWGALVFALVMGLIGVLSVIGK